MTILESFADGVKGELARHRDVFWQQAHAMLLAGKMQDAHLLAHKAQTISEAIGLVNSVLRKFKDPEEE